MAGASESFDLWMVVLAGAGGCAVVLLGLWGYLRLGWRAARPIVRSLPSPDVGGIASNVLQLFPAVRGRIWSALTRGLLIVAAVVVGIGMVGGGVFLLAARKRLSEFAFNIVWWESLPALARYAVYFVVLVGVSCILIGLVFQCRIVMTVRAGKSTRWRALTEELDTAIGHGGFLPTLFFGAVVTLAAGGWLVLWAFAGGAVDYSTGVSSGWGWLAGVALGAFAGWGFLWCAMYTFPVMAVRDPGWLSALEASIGLTVLRRGPSLRAGLYATGLAATVVYWPAALWMLVDFVEDQLLLVCVLLREKDPREAKKDLEEQAPALEEALHQADQVFQKGRYLDALNAYQMYYYKNPLSLVALEGIARAQLAIGNRQKAKEALERLLVIDGTHPGGVRMMTELQEGKWDAQGPLFIEAQRRCTQHLGKGLELRDTLDPALLREFEK